MISTELISERDNLHSVHTANEVSNIKLEGSNLNKNSWTHSDTAYFQRGLTSISIFTVNSLDSYTIFTWINNKIASWVIYHSNVKTGIIRISAMVNGKISVYSQKVNERNVSDIIYNSDFSNHILVTKSATAKPGYVAYNLGTFGLVASFTNGKISIITFALGARAIIAGIPVAFVFGVSSAIRRVGTLIIRGLAFTCNTGGYTGISIGDWYLDETLFLGINKEEK